MGTLRVPLRVPYSGVDTVREGSILWSGYFIRDLTWSVGGRDELAVSRSLLGLRSSEPFNIPNLYEPHLEHLGYSQ